MSLSNLHEDYNDVMIFQGVTICKINQPDEELQNICKRFSAVEFQKNYKQIEKDLLRKQGIAVMVMVDVCPIGSNHV